MRGGKSRWSALILAACVLAWAWPAGGGMEAPLPIFGEADPIVTFEDALRQLNPSDDTAYRSQPPEAVPGEAYFVWKGRITGIENAEGPYSTRNDPFHGGKRLHGWHFLVFLCLDQDGPFAFRDVKMAYRTLEVGTPVEVIGRLGGSIQLERPREDAITVPVLVNCYVR